MVRSLWLAVFVLLSSCVLAQNFEINGIQEVYKGSIGENIKAPLRFRNTSEKPITLIIRKVSEEIGSTQKNYFCQDANCHDQRVEDIIVRVEPGQTLSNLHVTFEGGLVPTPSSVKYVAFNKSNPSQTIEFELNFSIEEKQEKQNIYHSKLITLHDVYPNPSTDYAYVNYKLLDERTKAKIRVHNILGNVVGEYALPVEETLMRIKTEDLSAGIYFYTLYIENEGVMTRKLIVKK
jgi:hypothetical protein